MIDIASPGAYCPPPSALAVAGEIFGFRPGDLFESSGWSFRDLTARDFEAPPTRDTGRPQQFTLRRRSSTGETDALLYFVYDRDSRLVKVSLTFAGAPALTPEVAAASARDLQAFLRTTMGPEAVFVDRIGEWASGAMRTSTPEIAYAAAWSRGRTDATQVHDGSAFEEVVEALASAVITALVSSQKSHVMVTLIAEGAVSTS